MKLRELREQRQADSADPSEWTQVAVARRVGTTERTYQAWEAGRTPRGFFQKRLAQLFGVSVAELGLEDSHGAAPVPPD